MKLRPRTSVVGPFWIASVLLVMLGCARTQRFYDGPQRPASEVATVAEEGALPKVIMVAVNGTLVVRAASRRMSVELPPGPHTIDLEYADMVGRSGVNRLRVALNAEAGHSYTVGARVEGDRWFPVVRDVTTGRIVVQ